MTADKTPAKLVTEALNRIAPNKIVGFVRVQRRRAIAHALRRLRALPAAPFRLRSEATRRKEKAHERLGREGFHLREFAVPPPGVEMGAQVLDIAQRFRADFVIAHLFGGAPAVSIKEFKRVGYPLRKIVSFVWSSAEANIDAAGGFGVAEGYYTIQFAGVGQDYPVLNDIREMYKKEGKPAPKEMASTVFYNRGVLVAALHVEAIRNAQSPPGREDHRRRREGRLREDLQLHPRRAGAAPQDHGDRSRGRRARPDLAGEGRQVREGHGLVLGLPRRGG